ncbi:hypothetical protein [Arenimonas donghaensis]|uniref:CARDB domain-containing protein n=1 Tax=Arenimonas donghaensis DSM 18148 = HO3-R19 TaxID=1121014 RepID=A0A087MH37_9GAMM|nr:hypothetical protein [Arenimonas donghaensis]KFL36190.1 hypothetical protein N788_04695 [Arenimonas donghaensis DSM 18148 = HO3-R19]
MKLEKIGLSVLIAFAFTATASANTASVESEMAAKRAALAANAGVRTKQAERPGIPVAGRSVEELRQEASLLRSTQKAARAPDRLKNIVLYSGDTTGAPTWNRPNSLVSLSGVGTATPYVVNTVTVSANDSCDVLSIQPGWDGYLHVYENGFDPLDQLTNLIDLNDDFPFVGQSGFTGLALNAGSTYYFITSGFSNGDFGAFDTTIDCPVATVTVTGGSLIGVTLDNPASNDPVLVANELIIPPGRTIPNTGALNINTQIDYSFSPGEVRYARFHCPGLEFEPGATVTYSGDPSNTIGAVNGIGTDAIYFSITAGATPVVADDSLTVDGDRTLTSKAPIDCSYGLYDFPSQAQAGGATGRVATTSGAYVRFGESTALRVDNFNEAIADVESPDPAYHLFVTAPGTTAFGGETSQIGEFSVGTVNTINGTPQPITVTGLPVTTPELWSTDSTLVVFGDFGTSGLAYLSFSPDCSTLAAAFDGWNDSFASFTGWNFEIENLFVCYYTNFEPIRASVFDVALVTDSADPSLYDVPALGPLALGEIVRNGTELQAPLAQIPGGWLSRLVLTNTGSMDRVYQIEVFGETGNTITTDNLSGTVAANSTLVVDLDTILTGFTGLPRATLNVTVAAPNNTIQGLYQIVNPDSGSISNHVMVRPGSN